VARTSAGVRDGHDDPNQRHRHHPRHGTAHAIRFGPSQRAAIPNGHVMDAIAKAQCKFCGEPLSNKARGRPRRYCSDACRQAHRKIGSTGENGLRYRPGRVKPNSASEESEIASEFKPENLSPKPSCLYCERINDSTFKITNGELTNVAASHGKWGGYRTTKALAWLIKLGSHAWLARCGDQICNPSSFNQAKSQALAMARGGDGDYFVENPIRELNELQACLLDRDEDAASV
jgi:hypothetical protein